MMGWKEYHYRALSIGLILVNLGLIIGISKGAGWDYRVYCVAAEAFSQGKNPYFVANTEPFSGEKYSFVYPPSSLPLFGLFRAMGGDSTYRILWPLLALLVSLIVLRLDERKDALFLTTLVISGFMVGFWNMRSGNIGYLEMLFLSLVFLALTRGSYYVAAILLNAVAWLKAIPIVFGALFVFIKDTWRKKVLVLVVLCGCFLLIQGSSAFFYPELWPTYIKAITGGIEGQHNPLKETGEDANPTAFLFFRDINSQLVGPDSQAYLVVFIAFIIFIGIVFLDVVPRLRGGFIPTFSFGILALLLAFPRLKPYSFTAALIPIYLLAKDLDFKKKTYILLSVSVVPLCGPAAHSLLDRGGLLTVGILKPFLFLLHYGHFYGLLGAFLFLAWSLKQTGNSAGTQEES
jgi:hypothetical protein